MTRTVCLFDEADPLRLEDGPTLARVEVAYETWGALDASRSNAVAICGFAAGGPHAADCDDAPGWWASLVGPGKPVDTDRYYVFCADVLGGCRGTTGPASVDPVTGEPYGSRFPLLRVRDLVTVQRALCRHLGISRLHGAIGGSLGGMQVLQWALDAPDEISRALVIGATSAADPLTLGLDFAVRSALHRTLASGRSSEHVLAAARMVAVVNYFAAEGLAAHFGRNRRDGAASMTLGPDFEIEHLLDEHAAAFVREFDPWSYVVLSRVSSYFAPYEAEDLRLDRVVRAGLRLLAIAFTSDWRYGPSHAEAIVEPLQDASVDARHTSVASPWGHDSMLHPVPAYHDAVRAFLTDDIEDRSDVRVTRTCHHLTEGGFK